MTPSSIVTPDAASLEVDGHEIALSNLAKVVVPATESQPAWTKCDTLNFYLSVADDIIDQTRGRCTTMVRYPQGPRLPLYLKSAPKHLPDWITLADGPASGKGGTEPYIVVDSLATLVWAVNYGAFEFHAPTALAVTPDAPTHLVFDLDPGPGTSIVECARVALALAERVDVPHTDAVVKTSGSKGLHLLLANTNGWSTDEALDWSHETASAAAAELPALATVDNQKKARTNKVLIDWMQNQHHKTTAVACTLRLTNGLGVSTPVSWGEVEDCAAGTPLRFTPAELLERLGA